MVKHLPIGNNLTTIFRGGNRLRLKKILWLLFAAIFVLSIVTTAYGQIGNLDWADGAKKGKTHQKKDYSKARFQLFIESGFGKMGLDEPDIPDSLKYYYYNYFEGNEKFVDISIGGKFMVFSSPGEGVKVDVSILAGVGANIVELSFDNFRLLGHIGPEIGVTLPTKSNMRIRPFFSLGPGLSVLDVVYDENTFNQVWVFRLGVELGAKNGRLSFALGGKMIKRSASEDYYGGGKGPKETDTLGFLALRFKM